MCSQKACPAHTALQSMTCRGRAGKLYGVWHSRESIPTLQSGEHPVGMQTGGSVGRASPHRFMHSLKARFQSTEMTSWSQLVLLANRLVTWLEPHACGMLMRKEKDNVVRHSI